MSSVEFTWCDECQDVCEIGACPNSEPVTQDEPEPEPEPIPSYVPMVCGTCGGELTRTVISHAPWRCKVCPGRVEPIPKYQQYRQTELIGGLPRRKPPVRSDAPSTSQDAADLVEGSVRHQYVQILDLLALYPGGLTSYEIAREVREHIGVQGEGSISTRLRELEQAAKVHTLEEKRAQRDAKPGMVWYYGPRPDGWIRAKLEVLVQTCSGCGREYSRQEGTDLPHPSTWREEDPCAARNRTLTQDATQEDRPAEA